MKLTIVGCSGSMPAPDSTSSCYLVEHDGFTLVLDFGSGALGALQRHLHLDDIGAFVISHVHTDHCIDLVPYLVSKKWNPAVSRDRTLAIGPAGLGERLRHAYDWPPDSEFDLDALLTLRPVEATQPMQVGPFSLTFARAAHPGEAWSVRVSADDRALVYSGDTGATAELIDLAMGADVALFEAGWPAGTPDGKGLHLSPAETGMHARAAGVGRLIVTHVPPWASRDAARQEAALTFGQSVELAQPGLTFEI